MAMTDGWGRMMRRGGLLLALLLALPAQAALTVVASTTTLEALVREIGGEAVQVSALAPPDRDAHTLQLRPSMLQALRRADLVVAVGAELEVGWLPLAISSSANSKLLPGRAGYFEVAAVVPLRDVEGRAGADRARGDVHPMGNPHVTLDPLRLADAGLKLAERMATLDVAHAARYRERAAAFRAEVLRRLPAWQQQVSDLGGATGGAIAYHKDVDYLLERLGLPVLGYVEPLPGIPPSAQHLAGLLLRQKGRQGVIVHLPWQHNAGIAKLAGALGWPVVMRPVDPAPGGNGESLLAITEAWVAALAAAR